MCNQILKLNSTSRILSFLAIALLVLVIAADGRPIFAQTSATKTFSSASEASNALFQAAKDGDEQQLETILGAGKDVTSSGDAVEDKLEREQFTKKYEEMHRLVQENASSTILYIGAENWPFPIPLVLSNGAWHFDSDAGKKEILFRTIGENESSAIAVCNSFAAEVKQGRPENADDDEIARYAKQLASTSKTESGNAVSEAFRGYYFQRKNTSGHVSLIAYPAKYRSSGVMTFLVTEKGIVFEKDLGPTTSAAAQTVRNTDSSWEPSE